VVGAYNPRSALLQQRLSQGLVDKVVRSQQQQASREQHSKNR
jgi:hypothetical protein